MTRNLLPSNKNYQHIENVQKYLLKLLEWIKVACIMIPKKMSGPTMFK